ncbi:MAG TPA: hypothetical protein VM370_05495 [Candidatus Thermoplasmatota archaeon]|nr:hypothetical protein [Candidatus Thermoplasmatota archaeon]
MRGALLFAMLLVALAPHAPATSAALPHADPLLPASAFVPLPRAQPACATDHAFRVLHVVPPATLDPAAARAELIRAGVEAATAVVLESSLARGVEVRLRVVCDAEGKVAVEHVRVPTQPVAATFTTIVRDLQAQGYARADEKYWIVYEGVNLHCGGCAGQGDARDDDRATPENANNAGAMYAITYLGNFGVESNVGTLSNVMLHEATHAMGGVQLSAPHTSGAFHCNDGVDVMCQPEPQGTGTFDAKVCPRLLVTWFGPEMPYDCGLDDYFDAAPPAGSYLATHWNIGAPANRFVDWRALHQQP